MSGTGEQLSAFLDDELDGIEGELFIRRLGKDEELRETALRYAIIGDALRGDLAAADPRALTRAFGSQMPAAAASAVSTGSTRRRWLRPLAGAAVAASVAVVAVLSLQQAAVDELEGAAVTVPVVTTEAPQASSIYTVPSVISRRAGSSPDRLSEYYLNHSEYATLMGGQGQLARIVTTPVREAEGSGEDPVDADETTAEEQTPSR